MYVSCAFRGSVEAQRTTCEPHHPVAQPYFFIDISSVGSSQLVCDWLVHVIGRLTVEAQRRRLGKFSLVAYPAECSPLSFSSSASFGFPSSLRNLRLLSYICHLEFADLLRGFAVVRH